MAHDLLRAGDGSVYDRGGHGICGTGAARAEPLVPHAGGQRAIFLGIEQFVAFAQAAEKF